MRLVDTLEVVKRAKGAKRIRRPGIVVIVLCPRIIPRKNVAWWSSMTIRIKGQYHIQGNLQ